jgi:hypothetical protein
MIGIGTINLPALTRIDGVFNPSGMDALATIRLPVISVIGAEVTEGNVISMTSGTAGVVTFVLGETLKQIGNMVGNIVISSAALDLNSVNSLLIRLAALDGTNGTVSFDNRAVIITGTSVAPTATGLDAKAILIARGCTVTTN